MNWGLAMKRFTDTTDTTPREHAQRVIAHTASLWRIAPSSPHEVARRAPHGYVPVRIMRRLRAATAAAANQPVLAHSW